MVSYISSFLLLWYTKWYSCLSPILFTVYMDRLLVKLREGRFGCYIGHLFLGVVTYCDDFLLLSPTRNGLQNLLQLCEKFPNVFILLVDVTDNRWRLSLIIRSCHGSLRLAILVISFMNQVQ